ncbi:MAG: RNA methyltransferase [Bacteroidetes bacterium]|nr:RNA methyltransferase [Bacteroidota bacterium]
MLTNKEIKYFADLKNKRTRDEEGKFLIEGIHLIKECLSSDLYYKDYIDCIIARDDFDLSLVPTKDIEILYASEKNFNRLADTVNPQGIIAVVRKPEHPEKLVLSESAKLIVALDNINDPGNLGTIIRTCYWFNVDKILISKNSVDLYNSKVLRASQGAMFHVDILPDCDLNLELLNLSEQYEVLLTDLGAKKNLSQFPINKNKKYAIVFGNEANGISQEIKNQEFELIKIDDYSDCESLNLSVSAGILLYNFKTVLK